MKSKNNIDIALTTTEGSKRSIINIDTNKIIDLSSMIASKFNLFGRNSPTLGSLPCDIIMGWKRNTYINVIIRHCCYIT